MITEQEDAFLKQYCCTVLKLFYYVGLYNKKYNGNHYNPILNRIRDVRDALYEKREELQSKIPSEYVDYFVEHSGLGEFESPYRHHSDKYQRFKQELFEQDEHKQELNSVFPKRDCFLFIGSDNEDCDYVNSIYSICLKHTIHKHAYHAAKLCINSFFDSCMHIDFDVAKKIANKYMLSSSLADDTAISMINAPEELYVSVERIIRLCFTDPNADFYRNAGLGLLYLYCFRVIEITEQLRNTEKKCAPILASFSKEYYESNLLTAPELRKSITPMFLGNNIVGLSFFNELIEKCNNESRYLIIHDMASVGTEYFNDVCIKLKPVFQGRQAATFPNHSNIPSVIILVNNRNELKEMHINLSVLHSLQIMQNS